MREIRLCTECLDYRTGVKGVWLLFRRGKWGELARLGVKREKAEATLQAYMDANLFGAGGKLRSNKQVYDLLKAYPPLLNAAALLVHIYIVALASELPQVDREMEKTSE